MVPISAHALFARPMVVAPTVGARRRGARAAPTAPACCGATAAAPSTCPRAPGSRYAAAPRPVRLVRLHDGAVHRPAGREVRPARRGLARRRRAPPPRRGRQAGRRATDRCLRRSGSGRSASSTSSTLELGPGLTVITGETGAGKTMVVTALGLLLGGRADTGAVRTGATAARVEGVVSAADLPGFAAAVEEARRRGRGRPGACWPAPSRPRGAPARSSAAPRCPCRMLAELAEPLVAVHGQSDQHRLLQAGRAARRARPVRRRRRSPRCWRRYADLHDRAASRPSASSPRWSRTRPRAGPRGRPAPVRPRGDRGRRPASRARTPQLAAEESRLGFADTLRTAAEQAREALSSRGRRPRRPGDHLARPARCSTGCASTTPRPPSSPTGWPRSATCSPTSPPTWRPTPPRLETDPARLAAVSERRAALTALTRKYGDTIDEVLAWAEQSRQPAARARRHRRADRRAARATRRGSAPSWPTPAAALSDGAHRGRGPARRRR